MLNTIQKLLQRIFSQPTGLEAFIASKNPQNAGDVDHWMRVYTTRNGGHHGY